MKKVCPFLRFLFLLGFMTSVYGAPEAPLTTRLARVNVAGLISQVPFPVFAHLQDASGQDYVWVKATEEELTRSGLPTQIIAEVNPDGRFYLAQSRRPVNLRDLPTSVRMLHNDGRNLLLAADTPADLETLGRLGFELRVLPSTPMILTAPSFLAPRQLKSSATSNTLVSAMMAKIQQANLYNMVCDLSGVWPVEAGGSFTNIPTRHTQQPSLDRALDYAYSHLQALGLDVSFQNWSEYSSWLSTTFSNRNIVAVQTGTTTPSEIVIICGHIDNMPDGSLAPGADDNASGAVGVLAAASAMRRYSFERTIRYVLFTGEEQGLLGSGAYVSAIYTANDNVVGVYNLDMLAYDSNNDGKLLLHTRTASAPGYAADLEVASIFTNVVQLYGLNSMLNPIIASDGESASDHAWFWQGEYPAILAIENWMDDVTPYYHTTNDLVQTLNFPYFTAFTKAAVGAAAHLASPHERILYDDEVLKEGVATHLSLSAGQTNTFFFTAAKDIYYGVYVANATADVHLAVSPSVDPSSLTAFTNGLGWTCSATGTFRLDISSPSFTSADIRLYTLTNTIARVSSLITNLMTSNNLVGCGFSLVDGAHTVLETGFGYADRENAIQADADTLFMIGSCSKTFGALAAMQLVEEGLLDLDAPFTNALPSFSIHQRFADNVITPRTILTHHSGLPGDIFNGGFTVRPNLAASAQLEAMLADEYTLMPTNTFWSYNNSGIVMLCLAIEHLSGMSSDAYATTNLFQRMGMTHSRLRRSADLDFQSMARPYGGDRRCPEEYCNLEFAGSILSSASDMARYMKTILAGGMGENARVLSNNALNAMLVKQNADIPLDQFNSLLNMGIGFVLDPAWLKYMGKVCWHDGGTLYFRTLMRVATEAQLGCFISWNTAEAAAVNEVIVDSALKWAYEEKTGIAPPAPCDPGTPAPAIAPVEMLALATGGTFVTGSGYAIFATNDTGLIAHFNAQADRPDVQSLIYRDNGWFTPTNSCARQFQFTQSAGRILCISKDFSEGVTNTGVYAERSIDIDSCHAAWTNRLGRWWATDIYPGDISWLYPGALTVPLLDLSTKDNLLLLRASQSYVMSATNDVIAFAAGLGRNKGSALRVEGNMLSFMGVHYQSADTIPTLLPGASTNGMTTGDENAWISVPAPTGATFTVDLVTESEITAWLYDTNSVYLGQANRSHAYHFDATHAQPLMIAIVRDGTNAGPWQLTIHTNEVPFCQVLPFAQWPATLAEKSNLFPNTDFGYVFVPENRTNQTGNVLKIAIARMNSPNPSAQPLLFCNGGPGDSGIQCAYQYFLKALTNDYNVFLIDQRGVGFSQPYVTSRADEGPADLQYRLTMLQGVDLSTLNTLESSYDLDDFASVFAFTNANLHGVSYGTLLAQTLMRREPEWLRAVILDGVVAPNIPFISQRGPMRNDALNALFADIAAHPRASVYYPIFPTNFYTLATSLQNNPVTIGYSGMTNQVDGLTYLDAAMLQMTVSDIGIRERIPNIVYRASAGETSALAELVTGFRSDTNSFVPGISSAVMQMLVFNHDVLPFDSLAAASNACANLPPLLRQLNLNFMQQVVDYTSLFDPVGQADSSFTHSVTSTISTLVINGAYDTQTGTNWAAEVASHLPNSKLVIVPTVGHGVLFGGPHPLQIIRDFLTDPYGALDASSLTNMSLDFAAPWPTNTSVLALGQPVEKTFENAGEAAWYRFTAVSGLYYNIGTDLNENYARIVDANGQIANRGSAGNWLAPDNGEYYAWLIAGTSGVARMDWTCPLMVRDISVADGNFIFNWQAITNMTFDIWMSTNLAAHNSYVKVATNLPSTGWMNSFTNRMDVPAAFWFPAQAVP